MLSWQSIQSRLIIAFLVVVLFSLSGLSLMQVLSGSQTAQADINRQLSTVVSYKSKIIREWANTSKADLSANLSTEMQVGLLQAVLAPTEERAATQVEKLRNRLWNIAQYDRYFNELMVIEADGTVLVSSDPAHDGINYAGVQFFEAAKFVPVISVPTYSTDEAQSVLFAAAPITDKNGDLIGELAGRAKPQAIKQVLDDVTGMREAANSLLIDLDGHVIVASTGVKTNQMVPAIANMLNQQAGLSVSILNYQNEAGQPMTGAFQRLPEMEAVLLVEQVSQEVARTWAATLAVNLSVTLASVLVSIFIGLLATRSIANPITELVDISGHITESAAQAGQALELTGEETHTPPGPLRTAAEELESRAHDWQNEIGVLAESFNRMTRQVSGLIAGLESKVEERTRAAELHSHYLEASADVSRVITSILDPETLLSQAVELIRDRFNLYYVGLFLTDDSGDWAILRSGTGEAGQAMLSRKHRLRIESTSMIGWCIANDQLRLAQVATEDEVRLVNPDLPLTRSEAALPLHARGQVIGALTVQSSQVNAFDAAALQVLQTMADQLAVAIDNATLFVRSRDALDAERRAYALSSKAEWDDWRTRSAPSGAAAAQSGLSLRRDAYGGLQTVAAWSAEMEQAYKAQQTVRWGERVAIPIRVRGHVIGVLSAGAPALDTSGSERKPGVPAMRGWTSDEVSFLEGITEQLGVALDAARLYAETHKRAEQERLVDNLTEKMRATLDIQTVLETAAREMRDALGLAEVEVRLGEPDAKNASSDAKNASSDAKNATTNKPGNGAKPA